MLDSATSDELFTAAQASKFVARQANKKKQMSTHLFSSVPSDCAGNLRSKCPAVAAARLVIS